MTTSIYCSTIAIHFLIVVLVLSAYDSLPPLAVVEVPFNRLLYPVFKLCFGEPAELGMYLRRVNGISHIVTLAVGDVGDEGFRFAELFTNQLDDVNVLHLVMPADVVNLSDAPVVDNHVNRLAVILDVKPIADVLALAVDRQRFIVQAVRDHQRDQLFGKMVRPVIVRAARDRDGQTVGAVVCKHQQVGGRL